MQPRLVGQVSQRLRALIKGDGSAPRAPQMDIATSGLMGRVRDEWQSRTQPHGEPVFGLPQLLRSLHRGSKSPSREEARRSPTDLPAQRMDRDGKLHPLDDEFFARRRYLVEELTGFADVVFLEIAYRCTLKRAPDPAGLSAFLRSLRDGERDRVEILNGLSESPEGRGQGVEIVGLRRVAFWRRAKRHRHVGWAVRWVLAIASAGRLAQRLQVVEARLEAARHDQAGRLQSLIDSDLARMGESIESLEKSQVQVETAVLGLSNRYRRFLLEAQLRAAIGGSDEADESAGDVGATVGWTRARLDDLEGALREHRARLDAIEAGLERHAK